MPISGLVLTLSKNSADRERAIQAIQQEPRVEIGPTVSNRMAVVLDTQSTDEDKQLWNWLSDLSGVVFIDVVLVGFEQSDESPSERRQSLINQESGNIDGR